MVKDKGKNNIVILYMALLIAFLISSGIITILLIPKYFQEYARISNLLVWIGLFIVTKPIETMKITIKSQKNKVKVIALLIVIAYIVYFISGMFVGYKINPYSRNLHNMIINILYVVGLVLTKQYVRDKLANSRKKMMLYVMITIIFAIAELSVKDFITACGSTGKMFEYVCGSVIPELVISATCTYLVVNASVEVAYAYRLPIAIATVVLPIIPDYDWFVMTGFTIILATMVVAYNNYENTSRNKRLTRREIRKENPLRNLPIIILLIILVAFIAGIFPYKPVAVMSNSMYPVFRRGAVVISKKVDKYSDLNVGDILEYRAEKGTIIHRISRIEIQKDGSYVFITKGDNNDTEDINPVYENQVIATVKLIIPYIGYPAVLFSENILNRDSYITN